MIKKISLLLVGIFCIPGLIFAQTSEFTISVLGGDDTTPPTTPTLLSAIPVAQTQIDLTWSASTDNFLLDGYVLLRDGSPIATTTLTSYMDVGLVASTTYLYEVYAFDSFLNISTTSNAISTTTLSVPVTPPVATSTTETTTTGTRVLRLSSLNILPSTNSVKMEWQTNNPSRFLLRWGRSDAYDDGYILNDIYRNNHQTLVNDLEPGTIYLYELIGYGSNGIAISLQKGQFKTEARENLTPANVQNLQAQVNGEDVTLTWSLLTVDDTANIRVVRSYLGYPADPYDGSVVYEGKGSSFFDAKALMEKGLQYYTVFVIGSDGSISSGAIVKAKKKIINSATSTEFLPEEQVPLEEELVEIPDFGFYVENISINQGAKNFNFKTERIDLLETEPFIVRIPVDSLPKNLKSIIVTLLDPTDQNRSYSFLLRINKDRTAYEAVIAPLKVPGPSRLQVEIFDYERKIIGRYRKQIDFVSSPTEVEEVVFPDKIVKIIEPILTTISLLLLLVLLIMFFFYWRRRQAEDNH